MVPYWDQFSDDTPRAQQRLAAGLRLRRLALGRPTAALPSGEGGLPNRALAGVYATPSRISMSGRPAMNGPISRPISRKWLAGAVGGHGLVACTFPAPCTCWARRGCWSAGRAGCRLRWGAPLLKPHEDGLELRALARLSLDCRHHRQHRILPDRSGARCQRSLVARKAPSRQSRVSRAGRSRRRPTCARRCAALR